MFRLHILFLFTFLFLSQISLAQITGTVLETGTNDPLIGVNIALKNSSSSGTISDIDGTFSLKASIGDTIILSYIGYSNVVMPIMSSDLGIIYMSNTAETLTEAVVVGYGAVNKKDLTGVVSKISEKDFVQGSVSSPESLLNGKVAGLQINTNGEPGGDVRIRLRGGTSLDASSDPLIVIDGVPMDTRGFASARNPLNFINAADVESMTVLKDASAAAIYGSRGANGVIIITTKSGSEGKLKFTYDGNVNYSLFGGKTKNLNTQNFRNAISNKAPQEIEFLGDADTDWVDEVTQAAASTEHNISLSGGKGNTTYHLSGGYLRSNGVLITSLHDKKSFSGNISTSLFNNSLTIALKSRAGFTKDIFTPNVIGAAMAYDPTRPVFDSESKYGGYYQWKDLLATGNPVSSIILRDNTGRLTRSLNNLTLSYKLPFLEGLSLTSNTSYDYTKGNKRDETDPLERSDFIRGGRLFLEDLQNYSGVIETYGTYKKDLGRNRLELTAGHSWQEFNQQNRWEFGNGLALNEDNIYEFTTDISQDSFLVTNRLISFFGRTNISIHDKYLITASLRRDGSSRFGESNKWGLFPAAAIAWRVLEEDFASSLNNTFSTLKLRLSWGVTGNENISDFLFKTFYSYGTDDASYQFGEEFVRTLRGTGVDPNIKWEETSSINFGIDFGMINNRINGSLELYRKYTDDLLFTVATPAFTNLKDRVLTNIGEMENKGIELNLNYVVRDETDFDWDLGLNVATNQNEIKKLDNSILKEAVYETGGISGDIGQTIQLLQVGQSIETFRTYSHKLGSNGLPIPDTEDTDGDGFLTDLDMYEDINEDGLINEDDLTVGQTASPDLILGLNSNWRYKNWDLSMTLRSHFGNYVYNNVSSNSGFFNRLTDRVTNNVHESAFELNFKDKQLKSDYYIENASFLKLDNVTISYTLSDVSFLNSARLFLTFNNILTITGYSGLDPELPQYTGGIDNNLYPVSRNILFGVNANF